MNSQFKILDELSKYRSPNEMEKYFNEIIDAIKIDRSALELMRLRKGRFKEFQEEFVPAYIFSHSPHFPSGATIKIVLGNQGYDFVIRHFNGTEEKYEVSSYIDGEKEVSIAKVLNENGFWSSRLKSYEFLEEQTAIYMERTKSNILKKSQKDYTNISLVFEIHTYTFSPVLANRPEFSLDHLINFIQATSFRAKHVYLIVQNGASIHQVASNILKIK